MPGKVQSAKHNKSQKTHSSVMVKTMKTKKAEYAKLLAICKADSVKIADMPLKMPADLGTNLTKQSDGTFFLANSLWDDVQADGEYFAFDHVK